MSTQQQLTTEQAEVLLVLKSIKKYIEQENVLASMDEIFDEIELNSVGVDEADKEDILEALQYYGYIDADKNLTIEGKQYAGLLQDELAKTEVKKKKKFLSLINITVNSNFTGINFDKVGANIESLSRKCGEFSDTLKAICKKAYFKIKEKDNK